MRIRSLGLFVLCALAPAAFADTFYTVNENSDTLFKLDSNTAALTSVGSLGVKFEFGDLAYNQANNTMYMINGWGGGVGSVSSLYTVNLATGAATLVGSTGVTDLFGLVFDPQTGKMFAGKSTISQGFYEINPNTGAGTLIGNAGGNSLDGLTYVGSTGQIVGNEAGPGDFHSIDRNTGAATLLGGSGFVNNCGIAWLPSDNRVYVVDWSGSFYKYDPTAGYTRSLIANLGGPYDGLAVVPEPATLILFGAGLAALARRRRK